MDKKDGLKGMWQHHDYRFESLKAIVEGMQFAISKFRIKNKEVDWYDSSWLLEDSEFIFGLSFVALQNYINSSIFDFDGDLTGKHRLYKIGGLLDGGQRSKIELIIALANYFKHRDDDRPLHPGTAKILDECGIKGLDFISIEDSPVFQGLNKLTNDWDLTSLTVLVQFWRESMFAIK